MITVHCRTNLDLRGEKWPDRLPAVPRVGDLIQSATKHQGKFQLELKVVRVTWTHHKNTGFSVGEGWSPEIELHMSDFHGGLFCSPELCQRRKLSDNGKGSILAFYEWYARITGTDMWGYVS